MKLMSKIVLINLFCFMALPVTADILNTQNTQPNNDGQTLVEYLQNFGGYLGFDLTQAPSASPQTQAMQQLLSASATQLMENYAYYTVFGAMPVNALTTILSSQFVPSAISGSTALNNLANATFSYQKYSTPSSSSEGFTVSPLIDQQTDQQTYLQDPVSQAMLNILGTPDYSYCMDPTQSTWTSNCTFLYQNLVSANVVGSIPAPNQFFNYTSNQQIIGQLNVNTLLSPLLLSTENPSNQGTGSPTTTGPNNGLLAQNQLQEAANFIRYATGAVTPISLPQQQVYSQLYYTVFPATGVVTTPPSAQQMQAQATLTSYFANLRVFAAQSSVGVSNLYYIFSKRLPQKEGESSTTKKPILTSQALSEFNMATWRLFNPDLSTNNQWISQINGASAATVQKEIAVLMAEMNYQLYLNRQLQERILLTQSIMLIQNTKANQPNADFNDSGSIQNTGTGTGTTSTGSQ